MTRLDRVPKLLDELATTLHRASQLVSRGRDAFDTDDAVALAFEALSNRVGDLCKQLVAADPTTFAEPIWSDAAKNRDMVSHHYLRIVPDRLWRTVSVSFPELALMVDSKRQR